MSVGWYIAAKIGLDLFAGDKAADDAKDYRKAQAEEARRIAAANAKLSRYDAAVAIEKGERLFAKTEEEVTLHYDNLNKFLGSQKAALASSGVAVGTGSALDVQIESAKAGVKDAQAIMYSGRTASQQMNVLAERYEMLAESGMKEAAGQAYLFEKAGDMESSNLRWQSVSQSTSTLFSYGAAAGWFS